MPISGIPAGGPVEIADVFAARPDFGSEMLRFGRLLTDPLAEVEAGLARRSTSQSVGIDTLMFGIQVSVSILHIRAPGVLLAAIEHEGAFDKLTPSHSIDAMVRMFRAPSVPGRERACRLIVIEETLAALPDLDRETVERSVSWRPEGAENATLVHHGVSRWGDVGMVDTRDSHRRLHHGHLDECRGWVRGEMETQRRYWDLRADTSREIASARIAIADMIAAKVPGLPVSLLDIRTDIAMSNGLGFTVMRFEGLNDRLETGSIEIQAWHPAVKAVRHHVPLFLSRQRELAAAPKASDPSGFAIEAPFARFLMATRRDEIPAIMARVTSSHPRRKLTFEAGKGAPRFSAMIDRGLVRGSFKLSKGAVWDYGVIRLRDREIPETLAKAMVGRPVTDVVAHDLLDAEVVIAKVLQTLKSVGARKAPVVSITTNAPFRTIADLQL